jgi:hypothetical protein
MAHRNHEMKQLARIEASRLDWLIDNLAEEL